jgi:flagellar hook-associated protein 3 FlgL
MRVTEKVRYVDVEAAQARAAGRLNDASRAASSGLRVSAPSDDPRAFAAGLVAKSRVSSTGARLQVLDRASTDLGIAENALASASEIMVRLKEIGVSMANGHLDAQARAGAAKEVAALKSALVGIANSRGPLGYVFGGTATDAPPFDTSGTFGGNDGVVRVEIAEGVTVASNASGARAFTAGLGGRDVFADIDAFEAALVSNDVNAVRGSLDAIDAGHRQIVGVRTDTGLALERLRSASEVTRGAVALLAEGYAKEVEADAFDVFSELQRARDAFDRGVTVARQLLNLSSLAK